MKLWIRQPRKSPVFGSSSPPPLSWFSCLSSKSTFPALRNVPCNFRGPPPLRPCSFSSEKDIGWQQASNCLLSTLVCSKSKCCKKKNLASRDACHGVLIPWACQHLEHKKKLRWPTCYLVDDVPLPLERGVDALFALVKLFHGGDELATVDATDDRGEAVDQADHMLCPCNLCNCLCLCLCLCLWLCTPA